MPYEQGPLILQQSSNVAFQPANYDFTDYTFDQLGDIDGLLSDGDAFLADAGVLLADPSDPFPDFDPNAALDVLNTYADPEALLGVNDMVTALGVADLGLGSAIGFAPPEAFVDSTSTFVPPGQPEILAVPIIPADALNFTVTGTVGGSTQPLPPNDPLVGSSVTLTNLTAFGSGTFTVGDQFQVSIVGARGNVVYAYSQLNGVDNGGGPIGTIGASGSLTITGQMGTSDVGVWQEQWYVGDVHVQDFNFIVLDS